MNTASYVFSEGNELPVGTSLMQGHFTISGMIQSDRSGISYLAYDSAGTSVVIKECFPERFCKRNGQMVLASSNSTRADFQSTQHLFQNEARVLARLDHSNVIGIQHVFDANGTSYMVLDYVEGQTLSELITAGKQLSPRQITDILCDTLKTLTYVHEQGILHGDISPDSIIVTAQMKPYIVGFGAARQLTPDNTLAAPISRSVKDGYSPQEFYIAGGKIGAYSDLYSLAASFYQVISGSRPIGAQDRLKAVSRQKPDPYEALTSITADYPNAFCAALDTALAAFPRKRPQTANEWLDAIVTERPKADLIDFPFAHSHSPEGTGIYRSPAE
jgi:serine/threonine protein kinase